jgi:hypothetical protein
MDIDAPELVGFLASLSNAIRVGHGALGYSMYLDSAASVTDHIPIATQVDAIGSGKRRNLSETAVTKKMM